MKAALVRLVRQRAEECCEYCRMPQELDEDRFEIDHITARKHRGRTKADNLALACFYCNAHKGPNIASIDPKTQKVALLFHPRRQQWNRHFVWAGPKLVGRTACGRVTILTLNINHKVRVRQRSLLIALGSFPPD